MLLLLLLLAVLIIIELILSCTHHLLLLLIVVLGPGVVRVLVHLRVYIYLGSLLALENELLLTIWLVSHSLVILALSYELRFFVKSLLFDV